MLANGVNASEVTAATLVVAATTAVVAGADEVATGEDATTLEVDCARVVPTINDETTKNEESIVIKGLKSLVVLE